MTPQWTRGVHAPAACTSHYELAEDVDAQWTASCSSSRSFSAAICSRSQIGAPCHSATNASPAVDDVAAVPE